MYVSSAAAPRKWGYTFDQNGASSDNGGCPTQVGIYLGIEFAIVISHWLPHASGDIPICRIRSSALNLAAPRKWGYT